MLVFQTGEGLSKDRLVAKDQVEARLGSWCFKETEKIHSGQGLITKYGRHTDPNGGYDQN